MANPKIPKGYNGVYAKNADGTDTLIMVMSEKSTTGAPPKGAKTMAKNTATPTAENGNQNKGAGGFQPTFRRYKDMTESEQAAFRQGAKTSENKVKERLGFTKPRS